jgi:hypothetical protein
MRDGHAVSSPDQGTIYVVSVSGDKFYDQVPRDYTELGFTNTPTYQTIEVDNVQNRLTYRAWTDAGEEVDRVIIAKPSHSQQDVAQRRALGVR